MSGRYPEAEKADLILLKDVLFFTVKTLNLSFSLKYSEFGLVGFPELQFALRPLNNTLSLNSSEASCFMCTPVGAHAVNIVSPTDYHTGREVLIRPQHATALLQTLMNHTGSTLENVNIY